MYEYVVVLTTGRTFGSDSLTCTTYAGVISHEVCLAIIISSMKSPVVFASLILCDVFENGYCLWSLARTSKKSRVKVAPIEQKMNSTGEGSCEAARHRSDHRRFLSKIRKVPPGFEPGSQDSES